MSCKIALAGNPNSGKTTLFNALTGANQYVGNWPGVTVEKKEGKLKKHADVSIIDLPGIYSLSPYTLEEVVARNYLIDETPDAILNIVDGTNLERNLYLTTQLVELGIPVVVAVNMMDVVEKNGDTINIARLSKELGCPVYEISALKGKGTMEAAEAAIQAAESGKTVPQHTFAASVEATLTKITAEVVSAQPEEKQRWYAIKVFERDQKIIEKLGFNTAAVEADIAAVEEEMDDDAESIITNERYVYIGKIIKGVHKRKNAGQLTTSDKIDKIVTNRWLGLPIFALIMFIVYYVAMVTVGASATDWANDGLFGDGWHLFGIGTEAYEEEAEEFGDATNVIFGFIDEFEAEELEEALDAESEDFDEDVAAELLAAFAEEHAGDEVTYLVEDEETLATEEETADGDDLAEAVEVYATYGYAEPDPADYGIWVPGVPVVIEGVLEAVDCADWLSGLILDGIVAGVGAVLGFVPQMLVLFIFLAFLESCGYMARIAFILDRIFRRFGLSGKSFISYLVAMGCGVPGIMATRTIENEKDRRMTIITTTFIPCGAKLPFIAMISGAIFGGAAWVATSSYFIGVAAVIVSGIMLKKSSLFAGDPAPFVMELPAYHLPTVGTVLRSMWERGWSFIKKAGTVILLSTIVIWFLSYFGMVDGALVMLEEEEMDLSLLAAMGNCIAWVFTPLGWGNWQAAVASVTGLVAKENIVGTLGILYANGDGTVYENMGATFTTISGMSFLLFNLLCCPCFAAIGAAKREMNSAKWLAVSVCYQIGFAYVIGLIVYQFGCMFAGCGNIIGFVVAVILLLGILYALFRPAQGTKKLEKAAAKQ